MPQNPIDLDQIETIPAPPAAPVSSVFGRTGVVGGARARWYRFSTQSLTTVGTWNPIFFTTSSFTYNSSFDGNAIVLGSIPHSLFRPTYGGTYHLTFRHQIDNSTSWNTGDPLGLTGPPSPVTPGVFRIRITKYNWGGGVSYPTVAATIISECYFPFANVIQPNGTRPIMTFSSLVEVTNSQGVGFEMIYQSSGAGAWPAPVVLSAGNSSNEFSAFQVG